MVKSSRNKWLLSIFSVYAVIIAFILNAKVVPVYDIDVYKKYENLYSTNAHYKYNRNKWFDTNYWKTIERLDALPTDIASIKQANVFMNTNSTVKASAKISLDLIGKDYYVAALHNAKQKYVIEILYDQNIAKSQTVLVNGESVSKLQTRYPFRTTAEFVFAFLDGVLALNLEESELECALNVLIQKYFDSLISKGLDVCAINMYVYEK